jgi:hypothetical protein
VILLALLACAPDEGPGDPPVVAEPTPIEDTDTDTDTDGVGSTPLAEPRSPLSTRDWYLRAMVDLQGRRPSLAELDALSDDDAADAVAALADSDALGGRVADLFAEVFLTLDDDPFVHLDYFRLTADKEDVVYAFSREPLEILSHIVDQDLSYAELVTADWTMVNHTLAAWYPVDYPPGATGWQRVRYTDGWPHAGALSTSGLWWQYGSMLNNLNRGRANAYSRIFLCADYLEAEIGFDASQRLSDPQSLEDTIRSNPACSGCHDTLDPLAAHFYGFWWYAGRKRVPGSILYYQPQREREWATLGGLAPAFRGRPTHGLEDLGRRTAEDPAYARCAVERAFEGVLRRDLTPEDRPHVDQVLEAFVADDLRVRTLFRALVQSTPYREGDGAGGLKLASPATLGDVIADLTGFRWTSSQRDLMLATHRGVMALAGGVDGEHRTVRLDEPATTTALVHKRLAEAAAAHVVAHDDSPEHARLFGGLDWAETDPARQREPLRHLHAVVLADDPDDDTLDAELALWAELAMSHDPVLAWQSLLTVLLRDPRLVVY